MHRELSGMMSFCDLLMNFISFKSSCQSYTTSFLHNILSILKRTSNLNHCLKTEITINKVEFGLVFNKRAEMELRASQG